MPRRRARADDEDLRPFHERYEPDWKKEPLGEPPPSTAERQAELERVLGLPAGELSPAKCAARERRLAAEQSQTIKKAYES